MKDSPSLRPSTVYVHGLPAFPPTNCADLNSANVAQHFVWFAFLLPECRLFQYADIIGSRSLRRNSWSKRRSSEQAHTRILADEDYTSNAEVLEFTASPTHKFDLRNAILANGTKLCRDCNLMTCKELMCHVVCY